MQTTLLAIVQLIGKVEKIKGTVKQIKKALINDRLRVSKMSSKFHILAFYNFAVIPP